MAAESVASLNNGRTAGWKAYDYVGHNKKRVLQALDG